MTDAPPIDILLVPGGQGTRTYTVLRDGNPITSGPCSGSLPFGSTACMDTSAIPGTSHFYQVRYVNGCEATALSAGSSATDLVDPPPPLDDGSLGGDPLRVEIAGDQLTLTWEADVCAVQYNIYMGTVGIYWSHGIFATSGIDGLDSCFEPANSATFMDPGGNVYFLVAADNGTLESDLGPSTLQDPRPFASPSCNAHQ